MSRSLDVQSNARGIMIVKNMHKCHNIMLFYTNCARGLAKKRNSAIFKRGNFDCGGGAAPKPLLNTPMSDTRSPTVSTLY